MMLGKCPDHWGAAGKPWLLFKDWRNSLEVGIVSDLVKIKLEVAGVAVLAGRWGWWPWIPLPMGIAGF